MVGKTCSEVTKDLSGDIFDVRSIALRTIGKELLFAPKKPEVIIRSSSRIGNFLTSSLGRLETS